MKIAPILLTVLLGTPAFADLPIAIPHQGRIAVDGVNFDGAGQFKFLLFGDEDANHSSGNELAVWSNASTSPVDMSEPTTTVPVTVTKGLYSVWLGDTSLTNMAALPAEFDPSDKQLYLRIWFDDGSNGLQQLGNDQPIGSVPYALLARNAAFATQSGQAQTVEAGAIGSVQIANGAIQAVDLANNSVTSDAILDGTIASADIMAGAVSQLGTPDKLTTDVLQITNDGVAGLGTTNPAGGLHVAASADAISPQLLSVIQVGDFPGFLGTSRVAINSNGLLAAAEGSEDRLVLYSIADPANPVLRKIIEDEDGQGFNELEGITSVRFIDPNLLAVVSSVDNAVTLIDITIPTAPALTAVIKDGVGSFVDLQGAFDVAVEPSLNLLAIVSTGEDAVTLVDISTPGTPQFEAVIKNGEGLFTRMISPRGVAFNGNGLLAIISPVEDTVTFADVTTPSTPVFKSVVRDGIDGFNDLNGAGGVAFRDSAFLAVCGRLDSAVNLISAADPLNPILEGVLKNGVSGIDFLRFPETVEFDSSGLMGVVSSADDALSLFDITTPSTPQRVALVRNNFGTVERMDSPISFAFGENGLVAVAANTDRAVTLLDSDATAESGLIVEHRVGIGVAAPQAALHVGGDLRIEGATNVDIETDEFRVQTSRIEIGEFAFAAADQDAVALGVRAEASGSSSIALGSGAEASGLRATAVGFNARARDSQSIALGNSSVAGGSSSIAIGSSAQANGTNSIAFGRNTFAPSFGEIVIGQFNTGYTPVSAILSDPSDRLFVIGNGSSSKFRSDQLIIYKNGLLDHDGALEVSGTAQFESSLTVDQGASFGSSIGIDGSVIADDANITNAVVAGAHKLPSPQSFTFSVPGSSLIPSREDEDFLHSSLGYVRLEGTDTVFLGTASVTLPHGATIIGYDLMYYDNSATESFTSFTTRLRRRGHTSSQTENIAVLDVTSPSSPNNTSIVMASDNPVQFESGRATVDNNNFVYHLSIDMRQTGTDSSNLRCYGFRVKYTLDTLQP